MSARPVMFLRTAQTEQRITDLEEKMEKVMERLGMMEEKPVTDEEWERAAPPPPKPPSKIAQKVAKAR